MSDQQETGIGVTLDLEELFLSREFGRRPVRTISSAPASVASEPAQLEQVFLSEVFGHPQVVAAATQAATLATPAASGPPALVLLEGGAERGVDHSRTHTRAIAAVSGVAAAALVVAGLASGSNQGPGRPAGTERALGGPSGQGTPGTGRGSQQPGGPAGRGVPPTQSNTGAVASGGGATYAALAPFSKPVSTVSPPPAFTPATPPPGGGPPPATPPGNAGGSGMLTPALNLVGSQVSSVGSTVTSTAGNLSQALTVSSVLPELGTVTTSAVNNSTGGSPANMLAGA